MIEEFTIPRWAKLLTRLAERRVRQATKYRRLSRSIETREEILAALNEPFWDPVVEIVDPWRRDPNSSAFDTTAREASEIPSDLPIAGIPLAPISNASSELATRVTPAAATSPTTAGVEDDRLTRQLLATARALSVTWARDVKAADPDVPLVASEQPAGAADIAPASTPPAIADAPLTPDLQPIYVEEVPSTLDVALPAEPQVVSPHEQQVEVQPAEHQTIEPTATADAEVAIVSETVSVSEADTLAEDQAIAQADVETVAMPIPAAAETNLEAAAITEDDISAPSGSEISASVFGAATIAAEGFVAATAPLEPAVHLAAAAAALESVSERGPVRRAEPDERPEAEDVLDHAVNASSPSSADDLAEAETSVPAIEQVAYAGEPVDASLVEVEPPSLSDVDPIEGGASSDVPVDMPPPAAENCAPEESAEVDVATRSEPVFESEELGTADRSMEVEPGVGGEMTDAGEPAELPAHLEEATAAMPEVAATAETIAEAVDIVPTLAEPAAATESPIAEVAGDVLAQEVAVAASELAVESQAAPLLESEQPAIAPTAEPERVPEESEVAKRVAVAIKAATSTVLAPAVRDEYNRTNIDFRRPMPRPKVRGKVIDFHCHLLARRHAEDWFEAADHYGLDYFLTMSQLEECVGLQRDWGHRIRFIAVPAWSDASSRWVDNWRTRIEGFYNIGTRIAKFHASPGTMAMRGHRLDSPVFEPLFKEVTSRGMAIMTHIGDPDTWYTRQYADHSKFGSRQEHYQMWETLLEAHRGHTWIGAHMGGNPEDLPRLQRLLDKFPDLWLDCSATRWMVREISARREPAREFFIRNADRILFGSDQVSGDDRHFDFLASRFWCHRKLWETAYIGPSPIIDPDLPNEEQPVVRGLALPDIVLQKIYHDNPTKLLAKIGMSFQ